jgi:hypothetical protein
MSVAVPVTLPTGTTTLDMRLTYSRSTPRLEIIAAVPGTLWTPASDSGIHHLGYWSSDVATDAATLERGGLVREAAGTGPDGSVRWTYHRAPSGPRIELMSRAMAPGLESLWQATPRTAS